MTDQPALRLDGVEITISRRNQHVVPVSNVSLELPAGAKLAVVGESGSGKTMTASAILGLLPEGGRATSGQIWLGKSEVSSFNDEQMRGLRGTYLGLIPQDPLTSLNPVYRVGYQLSEALRAREKLSADTARRRSIELLEMVGIPNPEHRILAYPHEFSGGMRQRVLIAMALALRPRLLIADEPTTALDVTVQAQVLDLIDELASSNGTAVLLITHDLAVAAGRTDQIAVMRQGTVLEQGPTKTVLNNPQSTYTQSLLAASPSFNRPRKTKFELVESAGSQ